MGGSRARWPWVVRGALCLLLGPGWAAAGLATAEWRDFVVRHCTECHDASTRSGGLDLTAIGDDLADAKTFARWVKVHDRVRRGDMPPTDAVRPPAGETQRFVAAIDAALLRADEMRIAATGRVRLRRLTRREFENTLVDLLALPRLDVTGLLPADGRVAGYDKVAAGLDVSPAHLEAYAQAIEQALDMAIATRSSPPSVFTRRIYPASLFKFEMNLVEGQYVLLADKRPDPALPVRGGFEDRQGHVGAEGPDLEERHGLVRALKSADSTSAVGLLNPNLAGYEAALNVAPIHAGSYRLRISLWGFRWNAGRPEPCGAPQAAVLRAHAEGRQQEGGRLLRVLTAPSLESREEAFVAWLDPLESIVFDPVSIPWNGLRIGQVAGRAARHEGPGVALDWFEIEGPLNDSWPPESHRRLFGSLPIAGWPAESDAIPPQRVPPRGLGGYLPNFHVDIPVVERAPPLESVRSDRPVDDARLLLEAFLPRAFRRDVAPDEIEPYLALFAARLAARDSFEDAMRRVYVAVLTSPEFLFLPADAPRADAFALASRLSYWLWNGPPDESLLAAARDGSLLRPDVIGREVDRLLADRRSDRFIEDFADQWLELRRVAETTPDPRLYPEYRFLLHEGVVAEPRSFLRALIRDDLPARALLQPGFAMLTQRLAEHYGIDGVHGVEVRRVPLPPGVVRGGLLGQAAIHKLTANGTTTSPVTRGTWVMDRLLDEPPPPPPPGISAIDPDTRGTTTVREQLDLHRVDVACATCHARIDPPGFALEAFDPVGGLRRRYRSTGQGLVPPERDHVDWRVTYTLGPEVDASGTLADGRAFTGPAALIDLLAEEPRRLAESFVAHLSRHATGADVGYADRAEIGRIVAAAGARDYGLKTLVHGLARSRLLGNRVPSVHGGGAP